MIPLFVTDSEFVAGAEELGYPGVPVCFKPPVAKGSRGFRILSAEVDRVLTVMPDVVTRLRAMSPLYNRK